MESARLAEGAQAWRSPSHDKGASSELSGNTTVRPHYGCQASPRYGETQVLNHPNSTKWGNSSMESLGPGELKHGTTQTLFFIPSSSLPDIREITLGNHRPGETQAWKQPGWPRALKYGVPRATIKVRLASYLEIRPLGLIMAVRPHPDMVQLKYSV